MMVKKLENTNNTENKKDEIDYKKEIDNLKKEIMSLANGFKYLQDNLEKTLSDSIEEKLKEKEKSEQETKKLVDILVKNSMENNPQWGTSKINYLKNALENYYKSNSEPDMVIKAQDEKTGEDQYYIVEAKSKPKITQNELAFFKEGIGKSNTKNKTTNIEWNEFLNKISFDNNSEDMQLSFIDKRRCFLKSNPVKTYEEFTERIKAIDPNVKDEDLENIIKNNDMDYWNKLILDVYDRMQDLERYRLAKIINENGIYKHEIPYIKIDFRTHNLNNNLKKMMKNRGISQEQMAELIGVSRSSIISVLNNKGTTLENAFKISQTLQIPLEELFSYEPMIETIIKTHDESEYNQEK